MYIYTSMIDAREIHWWSQTWTRWRKLPNTNNHTLYIYICIYMYTYIYVYVYLCTYMYLNIHLICIPCSGWWNCKFYKESFPGLNRIDSTDSAGFNISKSWTWGMTGTIVIDEKFMTNLSFEISHFTCKTTRILSGFHGLFPSSDCFNFNLRQKISKSRIFWHAQDFSRVYLFLVKSMFRKMPFDG